MQHTFIITKLPYLPLLLIRRRRPEQRRELEPIDPLFAGSRHREGPHYSPKISNSFFDVIYSSFNQRMFNSEELKQAKHCIKKTTKKQIKSNPCTTHRTKKIPQLNLTVPRSAQNTISKPPNQSPGSDFDTNTLETISHPISITQTPSKTLENLDKSKEFDQI